MTKETTVPIIFGITGHRDLCAQDIPELKKSVRELFQSYRESCPNTSFILLSALAEGADMLVAEIARETGISLYAILPYEKEAYLNSFGEANDARAQFETLLKEADYTLTLPCQPVNGHGGKCYGELGKYIVDHANILIALWDTETNRKEGGTADVIHYARQKHRTRSLQESNGKALVVIHTPRAKNPDIKEPFKVTTDYFGKLNEEAFLQMLHKIDHTNKLFEKSPKPPNLLQSFKTRFDAIADKNQKRYRYVMFAILILTWIGIASMEGMHILHIDALLWGYGIAILLAFGVYKYFMKIKNTKNDYIYSRGLAEALRIQRAWQHTGIEESVARYYLSDHHHKFTWLRTILQNIHYLSTTRYRTEKPDPAKAQHWIDSQLHYLENTINTKEASLEKWEKRERFCYVSGFVTLVILFVWFALEQFHIVAHGILPFSWHHLVLLSGLLLVTAALIGEKYLQVEGFEEEIYNYDLMKHYFKSAQERVEKTTPDSQTFQETIFDLGKKALDENSKWVVLHESREIEPSLE